MCGICGFVGFEDGGLLTRMTKILSHRGPDNRETYTDECVGLGHTRLSIIDLSEAANQPLSNEDGSVWVTYNGEIYNFRELRSELKAKGHEFASDSDTEVIVHAYESWGDRCVERFDGMFAFALWDASKRRLLLARDRFGIKPLHYYTKHGQLFFASEIKAILQHEAVPRNVDRQSFHYFVNLRYVPGKRTMFEGIHRLLPGSLLVWKEGNIRIRRFWKPHIEEANYSESYFVKKTRELLEDSVQRHLVADVPLGVLLSGGLDSSTIACLANRFVDEPLNTFTMGFGNAEDEIDDARIVAEHLGSEHKELIVEHTLLKDYPKMIWYADEPKRNLYPYDIYALVKENVKTILGGLGGDEVFGGYVFKYNYIKRAECIRRRIRKKEERDVAKAAASLIRFQNRYGNVVDDQHLDYLDTMRYLNSNVDLYLVAQTLDRVHSKGFLNQLYGRRMSPRQLRAVRDEYKKFFASRQDFLNQVFVADMAIKMSDDFLLVDDRMSMANSLESRVPFLENDLVSLALKTPARMKLHDMNGKTILRKAVKDIVPKQVLEKKKRGFATSTVDTYVGELRECAEARLPEGNLVKEGYIKREYVLKILNELPNPRLRLHYEVLWNLYTAELWYELFINGDPRHPKRSLQAIN